MFDCPGDSACGWTIDSLMFRQVIPLSGHFHDGFLNEKLTGANVLFSPLYNKRSCVPTVEKSQISHTDQLYTIGWL